MKKEALEVLKNRRSIRNYKPDQIAREELDTVLEAGTFAPTARGGQSPVIVAVQDPDTVVKLDEINARVLNSEPGDRPYYGAPTILLVLAPNDSRLSIEDCSSVAGNLLNAAYAVGLGSCWINRSKEMFETAEGKDLLRNWGLEGMEGVVSIALGYADGPHPVAIPRKEGYIVEI